MNLSLAITIPDNAKQTLIAAVERHEELAVKARWVERDQLQLPVAAIGEISPAFVPHITEALTGICGNCPSFPVHVYGFGFYGTKRFPHSVWAAVDPVDEMLDLYEDVWAAVRKFGFRKPKEDYRPHIILGTFPGGAKNRTLIDALDADVDVEFGFWNATRLTLYDCRSGKRGKVYRKVNQLPFGG